MSTSETEFGEWLLNYLQQLEDSVPVLLKLQDRFRREVTTKLDGAELHFIARFADICWFENQWLEHLQEDQISKIFDKARRWLAALENRTQTPPL